MLSVCRHAYSHASTHCISDICLLLGASLATGWGCIAYVCSVWTTVQFTHLHLLLLNYAATSHHAVSGSPRHVSALKACRCLLRPCYCSAFEALLKHSEGPCNPFQSLLRSFQALLRLFEGSLRPIWNSLRPSWCPFEVSKCFIRAS